MTTATRTGRGWTRATLIHAIADQERWIAEHGGTLAAYVARYGSASDAEHYGNGGEAIYKADTDELARLRALLDKQGGPERLTLRAVRAALRPLGIKTTATQGDDAAPYVLHWIKDGNDTTADYYTGSLVDALHTGQRIADGRRRGRQ